MLERGDEAILLDNLSRPGTTLNLARYVKFTAAPTLFRTWRGEASATVRGIDVEAEAYLARGVSLFASGFVADQRGNFGGPLETIPSLSARMGIRVLFPGRPRIDLFRETDEALQREDDRRPGVRAR